jgi:hypothetical protein
VAQQPTLLFGRIEGIGGGIVVPFIGIHVATITQWRLVQRGADGRDAGLYNLHAALSFVNRAIWDDPEYEKEVTVELGRNRMRFRIEQAEGFATQLTGKSLTMEGVTPCRVEP